MACSPRATASLELSTMSVYSSARNTTAAPFTLIRLPSRQARRIVRQRALARQHAAEISFEDLLLIDAGCIDVVINLGCRGDQRVGQALRYGVSR